MLFLDGKWEHKGNEPAWRYLADLLNKHQIQYTPPMSDGPTPLFWLLNNTHVVSEEIILAYAQSSYCAPRPEGLKMARERAEEMELNQLVTLIDKKISQGISLQHTVEHHLWASYQLAKPEEKAELAANMAKLPQDLHEGIRLWGIPVPEPVSSSPKNAKN